MPSVTRDKKKYGSPTVYDKKRKKKVEDEIKAADYEANRGKESADGGINYVPGGVRKMPIRYE